MRKIILLFGLFICSAADSQVLIDSFDDGEFTTGPVWTGTTANWLVADAVSGTLTPPGSKTLRLAEFANDKSYLSTPNSNWGTFQGWGLWWGRKGAVNNFNKQYFWLYANSADVTDPLVSGYRLALIPDLIDETVTLFQLQRVFEGVVDLAIIELPFNTPSLTDFGFLVRVSRSAGNNWVLYTSIDPTFLIPGDGEPATSSPVGIDNIITSADEIGGTPIPISGLGYFAVNTESTKDIPGFAEYDQIYFQANGALPVELENFKAVKDGTSKARLDWKVGIEDNVKGYEIERSPNGINFSKIGFVQAIGSRNYTFSDQQILPGRNFYRLKTVDNDGTYKYSFIVSVNGVSETSVKVFPNPVNSKLYIQHLSAGEKAQLRIFGVSGQLMQSIRIPENAVQTNINVEALKPGIYNLIYDNGNGERQVSKFVKQ